VDEDEYFPPPRHIRELQSAMDTTISLMCGAPSSIRAAYNDHSLSASAVLAAL
jgi:4-hydroxy-3-methylbut-2-enyl diphosphate reductase